MFNICCLQRYKLFSNTPNFSADFFCFKSFSYLCSQNEKRIVALPFVPMRPITDDGLHR